MLYSLQPTECCATGCIIRGQSVGVPACATCCTLLLEVLIPSPVPCGGTKLVPANAHTALSILHFVPAPGLVLCIPSRFRHVVADIVTIVLAAMALILGVLDANVPALPPLSECAMFAKSIIL